jgi:hypothetical protein
LAPSADRKPAQDTAEHEQQHNPQEERRCRLAEHRPEHADLVPGAVAPSGRDDPDRKGDRERDDDRRQRQLERRRQALQHDLGDRQALTQRRAEVALDRLAEEVGVLDVPGSVKPEGAPNTLDLLAAGVGADAEEGRVPGLEQDHVDQEGDAEDDEHRLDQPPDDVGNHSGST